MMRIWKGTLCSALVTVCLMALVTCGGGGGSREDSTPSTGTLSISLTDAATTDYRAIYITVGQVAATKDGNSWEDISTPNKTYDLLTLVNGVQQALGTASLPSGHYAQVRLILSATPDAATNMLGQPHPYANYFIDRDNTVRELKVPSGLQTGIKIVKGFQINANQTTELLIDIDASRSIVKAGSSGQCLLAPTIRVLIGGEYATLQGNAGIEGVLVSGQVYSAGTITIQSATVSSANGDYKLFLEPGTYTVVAYKDGYATFHSATKISPFAGNVSNLDFSLATASTGSVTGNVFVSGASTEEYATIALRQTVTIGGSSEQIEVKSISVTNEDSNTAGAFSTDLPPGSYSAYVSVPGNTSTPQVFTISAGGTYTLQPVNF